MWIYGNPMLPFFAGAKAAAANIAPQGERGEYTEEMFSEDHPEFSSDGTSLIPETVLQIFITQANDSVLPSRWGSMWRLAAGLYIAHFSALYLKTYRKSASDPAQAAAAATPSGLVASARMGDTQINYDNSSITAGTAEWGTWNATTYGQQLITYARSIGMGGSYVI